MENVLKKNCHHRKKLEEKHIALSLVKLFCLTREHHHSKAFKLCACLNNGITTKGKLMKKPCEYLPCRHNEEVKTKNTNTSHLLSVKFSRV